MGLLMIQVMIYQIGKDIKQAPLHRRKKCGKRKPQQSNQSLRDQNRDPRAEQVVLPAELQEIYLLSRNQKKLPRNQNLNPKRRNLKRNPMRNPKMKKSEENLHLLLLNQHKKLKRRRKKNQMKKNRRKKTRKK